MEMDSAQDLSQRAKEAFEPKEGEESIQDKAKEAMDDAAKAADGVFSKAKDFLKNAFGPKDGEGMA